MAASSLRSVSGLCSSSYRSLVTSAWTSSFCEDTDTYSPAAMENAPAASPASPVRTIRCPDAPPPPTPAISDRLVTRPSIAPNTAGRSQPPDTSRCWCSSAAPCATAGVVMNVPSAAGKLTFVFYFLYLPGRCFRRLQR